MRPLIVVGVTGLEPAASWSRTMRATKLRYTPKNASILYCFFLFCKRFTLKSFFMLSSNGFSYKFYFFSVLKNRY